MKGYWHGFNYDLGKQHRRFCGDGGPWSWLWWAAVFAFACWTMSAAPSQDHHMGPGIWLVLLAWWYFWPAD